MIEAAFRDETSVEVYSLSEEFRYNPEDMARNIQRSMKKNTKDEFERCFESELRKIGFYGKRWGKSERKRMCNHIQGPL